MVRIRVKPVQLLFARYDTLDKVSGQDAALGMDGGKDFPGSQCH
jgi:hypothetical protein